MARLRQLVFTMPISELAVLTPLTLEVQRSLDQDRVTAIEQYQAARFREHGSFMFLGTVVLGTDEEFTEESVAQKNNIRSLKQVVVLDGQHRLAAMRNVWHLDPTYEVGCALVQLGPDFTAANAFSLINKAAPVPEYVMNTIFDAARRQMLEQFRGEFEKAYKPFLSKAARPRRPNVNLDDLVSVISDSSCAGTRFTSGRELARFVDWVNSRLATVDDKVRVLALEKAAKTGTRPLYLTADPDASWAASAAMVDEYVTLNRGGAALDTVLGKRPRPRIPAAVRNACWANKFGDAMEATCPVCNSQRITRIDFHAGHVVPHAKGGPTNVQNLLPLCKHCNSSMGDQYLHSFAHAHFGQNNI